MNWLQRLLDKILGKNKKARGPQKLGLCIGINNYPGSRNDLKGCVNDANLWATPILKRTFGYNRVLVITDSKATICRVTYEMAKIIKAAKPGDCIVIQFSGHGTTLKDYGKDEKDGRDEAICLYDGNLRDDDICKILARASKGVRLTVITDCCHSGTITRSFIQDLNSETDGSVRYMPPENDDFAKKTRDFKVTKTAFKPHPEVKMNEVLITGCKSTEYSYDARFGGKNYGAMTYNAWQIIKKNPDLTYKKFHSLLRKKLPSKAYPQSPQLEGRKENLERKLFI